MNEDKVVFLDCESTGLDPDRNEIWELAIISYNDVGRPAYVPQYSQDNVSGWYAYEWQLPVDLSKADSFALDVGMFHERRDRRPCVDCSPMEFPTDADVASSVVTLLDDRLNRKPDLEIIPASEVRYEAFRISQILRGRHIVGAVPSFDAAFLRRFLHKHQQFVSWHHHLIDVEALAVGYLAAQNTCESDPLPLPWDSNDLSRAVGVEPDDFERHTALGDALWAKAIYDQVMQ